jgi:membrane protease YdiL (CAAX protease family)
MIQSDQCLMPWDFWLIFFILTVVLPWRGRRRMQQLMTRGRISGRDRIKLYGSTILFQWALVLVIGWRAGARGLSVQELGLARALSPRLVLLSAGGAALISVIHWMNLRRMSRLDHPAIERLRQLAARLFPRSMPEMAFYLGLAVTAALCEEFIFRGFVMAALFRMGLSSWTVVLFSSVMFGVAHLYQGKGGSAGTGILGVLFAVTRIAYDSLLPVIVWHAAFDFVAGIAGARFFSAHVSPTSGSVAAQTNI